eukprot:650776-Lingulodinium_polyedra.AAC.1
MACTFNKTFHAIRSTESGSDCEVWPAWPESSTYLALRGGHGGLVVLHVAHGRAWVRRQLR